MKKTLCLLAVLVLTAMIPGGATLAQGGASAPSLPKAMPADWLGYRQIGTPETNGVTFVVIHAQYADSVLKIGALRLPNDPDSALIDCQVDAGPDDADVAKEVATASLYGDKILGTLCDLLTVTDEKGNNLLNEYSVSTERNGPSLLDEFSVSLSPENAVREIHVELAFGVNEDRSSLFPMSDSLKLSVPVQNEQS